MICHLLLSRWDEVSGMTGYVGFRFKKKDCTRCSMVLNTCSEAEMKDEAYSGNGSKLS